MLLLFLGNFPFYKFKQRSVINFKAVTRKGIPILPIYV